MSCATCTCLSTARTATLTPTRQQNLRATSVAALGQARRQLRCRAQSSSTSFEEWDIVLYETGGGAAALGRVSQVGPDELQVERLEEDATNQVWIVHGHEERVPVAAVQCTLEADYLQIVDPDRVSNPHGEHALEAYRLLEPAMAAAAAAATAAARSQQEASASQSVGDS